jgi:hypothetical protein
MCTLKHFPNKIEHCIQYARDLFEGIFTLAPQNAQQYLSDRSFIDKLTMTEKLEVCKDIKKVLVDERPSTFDDCINLGYVYFHRYYNDQINQLLRKYPSDHKTDTGANFWSGEKKCPKNVTFDLGNTLHLNFVWSYANLWSQIFSIEQTDYYHFIKLISGFTPPEEDTHFDKNIDKSDDDFTYELSFNGEVYGKFTGENKEVVGNKACDHLLNIIKTDMSNFNFVLRKKMDSTTAKDFTFTYNLSDETPLKFIKEEEVKVETKDIVIDSEDLETIMASLPDATTFGDINLVPHEFEKDDDSNYHMDFITTASNLRATNYSIENADKHKTKGIAGNIIPAIATTTSIVAGLVTLELYKLVQNIDNIEKYRNAFFNLALPVFAFSEPIEAKKFDTCGKTYTQWDHTTCDANLTLGDFISGFEKEHNLEIDMIMKGSQILFSFFLPMKKQTERKKLTFRELLSDSKSDTVCLDLGVVDDNEEEVEFPSLKITID